MRRYLRGAAPKLLVVFLCVAGVCALTAAALLAVLQQRDESAGPPYTACAVVDGVLDESTGTVLYNTPHATAPGGGPMHAVRNQRFGDDGCCSSWRQEHRTGLFIVVHVDWPSRPWLAQFKVRVWKAARKQSEGSSKIGS
jgi:ABC-type thiamine transport system substrate-binding protein